MRARSRLIPPLVLLALGAAAPAIWAYNNPSFREELFQTIEVSDRPLTSGGAEHTAAFALSPPGRTVELVWRVDAPTEDAITFSVAQGGDTAAEGLHDGAVSKLLRGDGFTIVDGDGAEAPFTVRVYANVIDRSQRSAAADGSPATPQGQRPASR